MNLLLFRSVLSMALLAAALPAVNPSLGGVPDSELTIPDELRFDAFPDSSLQGLTNIVLYRRYPETWSVTDLAPRWRGLKDAKIEPGVFPGDAEVAAQTALILKDGQPFKIEIVGKAMDNTTGGKPVAVATFDAAQADLAEKSFLLCFNRQGFAALYVNGKKVCDAEHGFSSVTADITPFVQAGSNTVALVNAGFALAWENELVVAPRAYVKQMLLTTDRLRSLLNMDCFLVNNGLAGKRKLTARITDYGDPKAQVRYEDTVERDLQTGTNAFVWPIRMLDAVCWSPDNPHLYEIRITDDAGRVLGKERFGWRDLRVKNGRFELNGKPIKLFGSSSYGKFARLPAIPLREGEYRDTFDKRFHFAYLRLWKQGNCNTVHSYSREQERRGLYEACDELGFIAYSMFPGWSDTTDFAALELSGPRQRDRCVDLLRYRYNHPSLLLITFGSELYEARSANLAYLHHQLKSVDKQNRLMTSAGRMSMALNKGEADATDFADDHSYWGTMNDSWMKNAPHFLRERGRVAEMYGVNVKPMLTSETFEPMLPYPYLAMIQGANAMMTADKVDGQAYVAYFQDENYGGLASLILSRGLGLKKLVTDEVYANRVIAELFQRVVESIRQEDALDGFLPFHITTYTPYAPFALTLKAAMTGPRGAAMKVDRVAVDTNQDAFIRMPQFYMMKRVYAPLLISARWFDRNLIAGSGTVATSIYAINDTPEPRVFSGTAVFRAPDGAMLHRRDIDFGTVPSMGRKTVDFRYSLPAGLPSGDYRLELVMFENGKRVSDNYYTVFVFSRDAVACKAGSEKKVAFYASESKECPAEKMLKSMALRYTRLRDFDRLAEFQVLIVGDSSMDEVTGKNGEKIAAWVEQGGRLLALAQDKPGYLHWLPDVEVIRAAPVAAMDMVEPRHPLYQGLKQEHFDTWSGDGYLFKYALDPLDKTSIGAGGTAYTLTKLAYARSIVSDIALGKGVMLLCQLELSARYGRDAVATVAANNLVRQILSDDKTFSEPFERSKRAVAYLERDACTFVDLKPHATTALTDNPAASDAKGGWDDYSDGNDCEVPVGEQRLNGIPYFIIPPEENQNRSVIMLHNARLPWSVRAVPGIKLGRKFHELHILHTGLSKVQDYKLTFRYEDGTTAVHEIKKSIHIGGWIKPPKGGWPQADFGWTGSTPMQPQVVLWHTKWSNPQPNKVVASMDIECPDDSGACIVAMTMYQVIGEEGWEDKRLQEEKRRAPVP